ncbi:hypothetical protein OG410_32135 [Streptomyces sp. NBC_00659]|uniref:SCO4225 family membrane protein n=1 Tax=unclassified Streptomyces TaxID=2593676 RepID=UPI002E2FC028|nr:hypothetical protein [Streptomyces sp. NBC_00659]
MIRPDLFLLRGVRRAPGTFAAGIYLTVCVLLFGWAVVVTSDESMVLVIPMFATIPASLVLLFVLPEGSMTFLLSMVLGALINALIIGWCTRVLSRGSNPDTAS